MLDLVTDSGHGDPKIFLNTPQQIPDASDYRFLNFRLYTEGPWQNVTDGMIIRWIWVQPVDGGADCYRVSQDIPFDVGWHIYSIDLNHPFNGLAEEVAGSCSRSKWHWLDSGPLSKFRFDPNENILGVPLHQKLDWVRLTKVERVPKGSAFTVQIGLNKAPSEINSTQFYYTNDINNPTQHSASEFIKNSSSLHPSKSQSQDSDKLSSVFQQVITLPLMVKDYIAIDLPGYAHGMTFNWDTSAVDPGEYHICARINDTFNEATYCSEATVQVVAQ